MKNTNGATTNKLIKISQNNIKNKYGVKYHKNYYLKIVKKINMAPNNCKN